MSEVDWYESYCRAPGYSFESSVEVAKLFASRLDCDPTNLRPLDRIDVELKFEGIHFLGLDEDTEIELIEDDLGTLLGSVANEQLHTCHTVGDVMALRDSSAHSPS